MKTNRHVLAVYKATDSKLGGIGAHRHVDWTIKETIATWENDPRTIRLQMVEVRGQDVAVLHDHIYHDRIAAAGSTEEIAWEVRRAARLDNHADETVHRVLFGDTCTDWRACPHRREHN